MPNDKVWLGRPRPLGATFDGHGTNFALFSDSAERVELCLFEGEQERRVPMVRGTGNVFHAYLPEVTPGDTASDNRVLLPVLGERYAAALEQGLIRIERGIERNTARRARSPELFTSAPRSSSSRRSCRCCFRARNGWRARRSATSPITRIRSWPRPFGGAGARNFAAFGWKPEDVPGPMAEETFRRSVLRWDEREREPHASMLAFYRALCALRASTEELLDGRHERVEMSWDERAGWLRVQRGPITLLANLGAETIELPRPSGHCVLAFPTNLHADDVRIALPPDGCAIWRG